MSLILPAKKKLLMAQKGGADVSEVFKVNTYIRGPNGNQTFNSGIDFLTHGGLVWTKNRGASVTHGLVDTVRSNLYYISSDAASVNSSASAFGFNFLSDGYSLASNDPIVNSQLASGHHYVSWQFRRAPKFFDVVQYTGSGVSGHAIAHNLGVKPGMVIVKNVTTARDWYVYHTSRGSTQFSILNGTFAFSTASTVWNNTEPNDTHFTVGTGLDTNGSGNTYIAYLFAHDPSPEGFIQCGSYVGNGSATGPVIDLGWKPQYLMVKPASTTGGWQIIDAVRGFTAANDALLLANTAASETSANMVNRSSTGFQLASGDARVNASGQTYIYMAIRAPEPTEIDKKIYENFNTSLWTGTGASRTITTDIDSDEGSLVWITQRNQSYGHYLFDTIRGTSKWIGTDKIDAEATNLVSLSAFSSSGYSLLYDASVNGSPGVLTNYVGWQFRRDEKFFDIVQYTGDGAPTQTISHSLGSAPGMFIVKRTSAVSDWEVFHKDIGKDGWLVLNTISSANSSVGVWGPSPPTDSSFVVSSALSGNTLNSTYIAYLFAHDPSPEGIIQCGSYVGNGASPGPVVNLGWKPQYLMIKGSTASGGWQIIDAQRGFTSGNDAILLANTNGTETSSNRVNPTATGFQLASTASNVNTSGQTYIYVAIREAN